MSEYKIYCDLDGVITNFNKAYYDLTGIDISGNYNTSKSFWTPIDKAGLNFWVNMEWMPDGKELWSYISKYKPIILSSPSKKNESRIGKITWVEKELPGTEIILRSSSSKREFADPKHILIDDRVDNIEGWIEDGGIGILHRNANETIKKLKELGL